MLDSRGKTKGGWFFILGFNMLKPNMSNTISIGTCSSDLYIHYFFETSGTASCGTTGIPIIRIPIKGGMSLSPIWTFPQLLEHLEVS